MVDSRAWMMDHKPQKKWEASENLSETQTVRIFYWFWPSRAEDHLDSLVHLHVQLLLQLPLVLFAQNVKASIELPQVVFNEVKLLTNRQYKKTKVIYLLERDTRSNRSLLTNHTHLLGFRRVVLRADFEEGKLVAGVVVHPLAEMVADVKSSEKNE